MNSLFSLGYSTLKVEQVKTWLDQHDALLVDVRHSPQSRNPQWRQPYLQRLLGSRYRYVPEFGNLAYRTSGPIQLVDETAGVRIVSELLEQRPVVLLCQCADHTSCHRSVAAAAISKATGVRITHLGPDDFAPATQLELLIQNPEVERNNQSHHGLEADVPASSLAQRHRRSPRVSKNRLPGIKKEVKPDGTVRYKVRVSWMEGGKQRQVCERFRTLAEAQEYQTKQKGKRDHGTLRRTTRLTLNEHFDVWLRSLHDRGARTRVDYENVTRRYWRPMLGNFRLNQLTTPVIRDALADMGRPKAEGGRGLGAVTLRQAHAILRAALGSALDDGLLDKNPAIAKHMIPLAQRREQRVLTGAQVNSVLDITADDPLHALWAVAFTTGVRPGEALGLKWSDLDLERAELRVQRALVRPVHGAKWLLEDCKTEKSRRAVPLIPRTVEALRWHRVRQESHREAAGTRYTDHGFMFADTLGEPLQETGVYKYHWLPALNKAGVPPVTLYAARHGAATMWLEAGLPMKLVQELLGHASMTMTADVYSHILPAFRRQAADAMAAHLERTR
jgi:integrase